VDLDFLYPFFADKRVVAITGTDGKTTTTTLTGELLATLGPVVVAGNIGVSPFACFDELRAADRVVFEVSSFMLEGLRRFRPHVAAILNVAEDHVDRYRSLDEYGAVKCGIARHCSPQDVLLLNDDDPRLARFRPANVAVRRLSRTRRDGVAACFRDGTFEVGGERYLFAASALRGQQNELNVLTALAIAHEEGAEPGAMRDVLGRFRGLRHRLEHVGCFGGVDAYDDSKASNVHAVEAALGNFPANVVLILGGRDKGLDFTPLRAHAHRLRRLVCYGEHGERIRDALDIPGALYRHDFEDAVACAAAECRPGDALVLSPGCTSWDQFPNYEVRGDAFRALAARHLGSGGRA
ncbi:MAG: UDP-N-acetylmuramoyl-L-alanine--D-glutamate ligase, partial [Polyangiaceae bacterium]|nr:UDP-N-acetylmuramoyl-L-alanine--D-glutamate ligase [Polyangiaceae bacterium]